MNVHVLGLASIASDVSPQLALQTSNPHLSSALSMPLQQSRPLSASASAEASLQRKRTHELSLPAEMMDILRLTKTGKLMEATAAIQRALRGGSGQADNATHSVALDATQTSAGVWTIVQDHQSVSACIAGRIPRDR